MRASRSIRAPSTFVSQKSRSLARNSSPRWASSSGGIGWGWIRSSRKRPRNSSLAKLGLRQSCSRAASATSRASRSVTVGWVVGGADMRLTSPRIGILGPFGYRRVLPDRMYPIPADPTTLHAAVRPMSTEYASVSRRPVPLKTSVPDSMPETYLSLLRRFRRTRAWVKSSRLSEALVVLVRRTKE